MAEFKHVEEKLVKVGEKLDIEIPKTIATVKFDALHAGTYIVNVHENGNWCAEYFGKNLGVEK